MPEARYPTEEEFWTRLRKRRLEPDLQSTLRQRASRATGSVSRLGDEATVIAVVERILPRSAVPAAVIAGFLDENFDKQLGRGDERTGVLPRAELLPLGFSLLNAVVEGSFAQLESVMQDGLLRRAEQGQLQGPAGFDSAIWFKRLRDLILLAFGSDPRGMVQMGYPGPSYQPGHVWLGKGEIEARTKRRIGYLEL